MSASDPTTLAPDRPLIVDGFDWTWAFVLHRDIPGWPGYKVGSDGTIWTCKRSGPGDTITDRWRPKSPTPRSKRVPYPFVLLSRRKAKRQEFVHTLVLEAFRGPRPEGMQGCHFPDRDPANNRLRNLRWGTQKDNAADAIDHGTQVRGSRVTTSKLTEDQVAEIRRLAAEGVFIRDIAPRFGVDGQTAYKVVSGRNWKHVASETEAEHRARRVKVQARGSRMAAAKLTESDIPEVFRLAESGLSQRAIASRLGVSQTVVWHVLHGRSWRHVENPPHDEADHPPTVRDDQAAEPPRR